MDDVAKQKYQFITTKDDRELLDMTISEKNYYEDATKTIRNDIYEEVWKLYTQYVDPATQPYQSSKRLPKTIRAIDTLAAFLVASEPTYNVLPVGDGDEIKSELVKELLIYQGKRKDMLNLKRNAKLMVKCATLFGNSFPWVTWKTLLDEPDEKGNKKVLFDGPVLEIGHPADTFTDPFIGEVIYQKSVIRRFTFSLDVLREDKSLSIPKDYKSNYVSGAAKHRDSSALDKYDLNVGNESQTNQDKVEVWERWTKNRIVTWIDPEGQPIKAKDIKNKYGFISMVNMMYEIPPVPNRFLTHGAIGPNIKTEKGINEATNHIIDNIRLILNSMWKRRRGSKVDPRQFVARPGGVIDVESMDDVSPIHVDDTTGAGFNLLKYLNSEYQAGTAISSARQGIGGGADSATEAGIQQDNADVITNSVKDNFETALAEIGTMVAKMNVMMMQGSQSIRIFNLDLINQINRNFTAEKLGPDQMKEVKERGTLYGFLLSPEDKDAALTTGKLPGLDITPEKMQKIKKYGQLIKFSADLINVDTDIQVEADSTMNKNSTILRKQILNMVQVFNEIGAPINHEQVARVLADLSGIPGVEKFIASPQEQKSIAPPQDPNQPPSGPPPGMIPPGMIPPGGGAPPPPGVNVQNNPGVPAGPPIMPIRP